MSRLLMNIEVYKYIIDYCDQMSLGNFHSYFYPPHKLALLRVIDSLSQAHHLNVNHVQLTVQVKAILENHKDIVLLNPTPICRYIQCNIQGNIELVNSLSCLPVLFQHTSSQLKKQISSLVMQKYPSNSCFYAQIEVLSCLNLSLLEPFFVIIRSITQWFLSIIQENDYSNVHQYEVEYLLNYIHAEQRYKFQNGLQIQGSLSQAALLSFYQFIHNYPNSQIITTNQILKKRVVATLFYFLSNFNIKNDISSARVIFYSIGNLLSALKQSSGQIQGEMVELLMRKVSLAEKIEEKENAIELMKNVIVNVLLCCWTVQIESFWLWRFKLISDLLGMEEKRQLKEIVQIRQVIRDIQKYVK